MGVTVEVDYVYGLTSDQSHTRPADILVARLEMGLPVALDMTVTSPHLLLPFLMSLVRHLGYIAAVAAEFRKHVASVLSWDGPVFHWLWKNWTFSQQASPLAASHSVTKSKAVTDIYGRLNLTLTRSAILTRGVHI